MLSKLFSENTKDKKLRFLRGELLDNGDMKLMFFRGPNDVVPYKVDTMKAGEIPKKRMSIYNWLLNRKKALA